MVESKNKSAAKKRSQQALEKMEKVLRKHQLRLTRQRVGLAELLFTGQHHHISAEQLYKNARTKGLNLSLATIYNTLNQWAQLGLLRRVQPDGGGLVYFDTNVVHHHHFYDQKKDHLIDLPEDQIKIVGLPKPPHGTEIESVDVVIRINKTAP